MSIHILHGLSCTHTRVGPAFGLEPIGLLFLDMFTPRTFMSSGQRLSMMGIFARHC